MTATCNISITSVPDTIVDLIYDSIPENILPIERRDCTTDYLFTIVGPRGGRVSFPIAILQEYLLAHSTSRSGHTASWKLPGALYPHPLSSYTCHMELYSIWSHIIQNGMTSQLLLQASPPIHQTMSFTEDALISIYHTCKVLTWCIVTEYDDANHLNTAPYNVSAYDLSRLELVMRAGKLRSI